MSRAALRWRIFAVTLPAVLGAVALTGCSLIDSVSPKSATRDEGTSEVTEAGKADVFTLEVGDCFDDTSGEQVSEVPAVPCAEPHDYEAFNSFMIEGSDFPGDDVISQKADTGCGSAFDTFVGVPYEESALNFGYLFPTEDSWTGANDREILCYAYEDGAKTTGSLADAAR